MLISRDVHDSKMAERIAVLFPVLSDVNLMLDCFGLYTETYLVLVGPSQTRFVLILVPLKYPRFSAERAITLHFLNTLSRATCCGQNWRVQAKLWREREIRAFTL